jgi:hypothetical protein
MESTVVFQFLFLLFSFKPVSLPSSLFFFYLKHSKQVHLLTYINIYLIIFFTTHSINTLIILKYTFFFVYNTTATLDTELTGERDQLSKSKRARERMRAEGTALQGEQGFVSNDSLVQDYERRKIALREKNGKVVQLQQKHAALMASINRDSMALNGGGNGPVLE